MEKQGLLSSSGMFMKMDVDNLLHKGDQRLNLLLEFQVSYWGLFPVSTLASPTHNPNYW